MADPRLFPSGSNSSGDASGPGRRKYNPYHDLSTPYSYQTLYDLPTSPEFLFQEESAAQRRSWGENLTYYTGVGYLSGAVAGAALGLRDAAAGSEPRGHRQDPRQPRPQIPAAAAAAGSATGWASSG
ncbi:hypothetical protein OsJ_32178 [Oryza sativa Japonica Group]|uniref:Uncharacterized protein n=1 Tax=Oryza sativa subsp. japonica TaxID=39947 RepID=A3C6I9_ORYSJ|nr:hypothetical protein OsJ_32178 [Oryza sativa Japonica Group]